MGSNSARFSIRSLMLAILMLALQLELLKMTWRTTWFVMCLMVLPMLDLMLAVAPKLRRAEPRRPYWAGFEAAGAVGLVAILLMGHFQWETLLWPIFQLEDWRIISEDDPVQTVITCAVVVAFYGVAQVGFALAVGWFCGRYRVVIQRRACA